MPTISTKLGEFDIYVNSQGTIVLRPDTPPVVINKVSYLHVTGEYSLAGTGITVQAMTYERKKATPSAQAILEDTLLTAVKELLAANPNYIQIGILETNRYKIKQALNNIREIRESLNIRQEKLQKLEISLLVDRPLNRDELQFISSTINLQFS